MSLSWIPGYEYIKEVRLDAVTTSVVGGAIGPLGADRSIGISFQNVWNQSGVATLAATLLLEASNDPRADPNHEDTANAIWTDITSDVGPTNPTATAGDQLVSVGGVHFEWFRQTATRTGGDGLFQTFFSAHGS